MARKVSKGKKPTETMRQRQQRLLREQKARKAAASKPVKYKPSKPASQSVEKVKVKVEGQKQLPGGKPQKALPPGKKGGPVSSTRGPRRTNVNSNPSKGTQMGTRGGGVKVQPRLGPGTIRSAGAGARALSTTGKVAGRIALPIAAYQTGKDLKDSLDRGEGYARLPGLISKALKGKDKNSTTGAKTNRRGRPTGPAPQAKATPTKPKPRGISNIPKGEGTGKGSPNDKAPKAAPTPAPTNNPPNRASLTTPTRTPDAPKKPAKKGATSTYKAHGSDLHVGRHKTLKEHRAAVAATKKKKKPDSSQIRAMSK